MWRVFMRKVSKFQLRIRRRRTWTCPPNSGLKRKPESGASFSPTPPGDWTVEKLFRADGEGEIFLNLNERDGVGEFSLKDSDYAAVVVTELAKIFLPRAG
jgi:hypothetical protein